MKNTLLTFRFMRFASLIGIILLLVLQYMWFMNSYIMIERDILEKCKHSLREAVDDEMFERMDKCQINIGVTEETKINKKRLYSVESFKQKEDLYNILQRLLTELGCKASISRIDTLFKNNVEHSIGYVPEYKIYLGNDTVQNYNSNLLENSLYKKNRKIRTNENDSVVMIETIQLYDKIIGNNIYIRINSYQVIKMELISATNVILKKARYILIISILLVILIGFIMVFQMKSMLREKRFIQFIKEYTSALTHDLRGPLNSINMAATLLCNEKFEHDPVIRRNYYYIFRDQSAKLMKNIDKIMTVTKAEQTIITVNKEPVHLKLFLENIAETFRNCQMQAKENLQIDINCQPEDLEANIDVDKMENVINNLIDNAIKYSYESVHIVINCDFIGNNVQINVADNGMGIPAQDLDSIFKNFRRGSQIERKRIFGYGIGLSFVKKVIQAHGGTIQASSKEGEGSVFNIKIPK